MIRLQRICYLRACFLLSFFSRPIHKRTSLRVAHLAAHPPGWPPSHEKQSFMTAPLSKQPWEDYLQLERPNQDHSPTELRKAEVREAVRKQNLGLTSKALAKAQAKAQAEAQAKAQAEAQAEFVRLPRRVRWVCRHNCKLCSSRPNLRQSADGAICSHGGIRHKVRKRGPRVPVRVAAVA